MVLFDLLAADFRSALAGRGMNHDQETVERSGAWLRLIDKRGSEVFAGQVGVDELLSEDAGCSHSFGDDGAVRDLPQADAVISRPRKGSPRRNEDRLAGGSGVSAPRGGSDFLRLPGLHNYTAVDFLRQFKYTCVNIARQ